MPPRIAPRGSGSGGGRGGRGGPPRGGGPGFGPSGGAPNIASHITTVGIKRPAYGSAGRGTTVITNHFECNTPDQTIYHYDVVILPSEKALPARLNMDIITSLQDRYQDVFTPPAVYDGRKNLFAPQRLPLKGDSGEFDVTLTDTRTADAPPREGKGPKVYKVRLKKVAEVNPVVLNRYLEGKQSHDNEVLTAITALNVVIRMEPTIKYPFNVRSFFTNTEIKEIGGGLTLWRGYFQSIRPAVGRMLINVDISTGTMYKEGPLLDLCLHFLGSGPNPRALEKGTLMERDRHKLQRFIQGVRIVTIHATAGSHVNKTPRVIKRLEAEGASRLTFEMRDRGRMTVAAYFQQTYHKPLRFPNLPCVEVGNGALLPIELCMVIPGQIMRKQIPPEKTKDVLEFATKQPQERLRSITAGLGVLQYGQSPYVRHFHLNVRGDGPVGVHARVLDPPTLLYGQRSRQPTIRPSNGSWNMVDKKFYRPASLVGKGYLIVIFERQGRFGQNAVEDLIAGLSRACDDVGIQGVSGFQPVVQWLNGQGNIAQQLRNAGAAHSAKYKSFPGLIVAVMPEGSADIYHAAKHFGDITTGVATQCLKSSKCFRAKPQYYANVCLKINVKLGGINTVPEPSSVSVLSDPAHPTIVMGADVIHPAPGSDGRPSFTALVGNVDSDNSKYIATTRVQTSRQEQIEDIGEMTHHILSMYTKYRQNVEKKSNVKPRRIIFYRDGVSEGQFQMVLNDEVKKVKQACRMLDIDAKLTVIVVGKRHHVRLFPQQPNDRDRSGNCMAGTVVDREITHPTEFDFYLQSHGGLLGTSRPAHYSVLLDENHFTPDQLQGLSFALCHVYARSTRSVSIPAPVYYADIVCSRAKNHYDPSGGMDLSGSETQADSAQNATTLEAFRQGFKNLHPNSAINMYFS